MVQILTHRGLEPEKKDFFGESTYEAFADQSARGFGLEFDVNFTTNGQIMIFHDERVVSKENLCNLEKLLELIESSNAQINALHLKGKFQDEKCLDILVEQLKKHPDTIEKIVIFDVKIETAKYLKEKLPNLHLSPSVAHKYDIERYNGAVGGTLITTEEALRHQDLFEWVWLDEWDRADKNGENKSLYNRETFQNLRDHGLKIALVTPELHATSPGLLGGESHEDASSQIKLTARIKEIVALKPDAICTDYPALVQTLIKQDHEIS